jgi:formylglycine-generating enzyme required for sulfatase activity
MAGNVYEWVNDWYNGYPDTSYQSDHFGMQYKVLRGGAWGDGPYDVRSASRYWYPLVLTSSDVGLRCGIAATASSP